jgi:two-component system, LuxR family, response regulator FixJ
MLAIDQRRSEGEAMTTAALVMVACADSSVGDSLRMFLNQYGCSVELFRAGTDLMGRLREKCPALVIIDIELADGDGIALMQKVHRHNQAVPVIVLGKQGDVAAGVQAMRNGALDFLEKPFFQSALRQNVEQVLSKNV